MKIAVVGPGAMGCLFAGLLVESGQKDVWLFDKYKDRAAEIAETGLKIEGIGGTRSITEIKATSDPQEIDFSDLLLIFVKSYDTEQACYNISPAVRSDTTVLTLQNGLTNIELISQILGESKVVAGTTSHGATMLGNGHIRHAGVGETVIGELSGGKSHRTNCIANIFGAAGFQTTISCNIYSFIWAKLIINAAINPVTAITRLKNGELLEHDEIGKLLSMTGEEAAHVAVARQISLPFDDVTSSIEAVCKATSFNISSMLQDVSRRKHTEIDAINGAIVNEASKMGIEAPINRTLTYLVKGIENSWRSDTNLQQLR